MQDGQDHNTGRDKNKTKHKHQKYNETKNKERLPTAALSFLQRAVVILLTIGRP